MSMNSFVFNARVYRREAVGHDAVVGIEFRLNTRGGGATQ
jgi:hypothetical protein